jgi:hypothetical protein
MVDNILIGKKECTKCNMLKDVCEFRVRRDRKSGYRSSCKECDKKSYEKWVNNNLTHFKERSKNYNKKYYEDNLDYFKGKNKKYYKENKILCNQNSKNFKEQNPNYRKEYDAKKRQEDPIFKIKNNVRVRLYKFLKLKNITKNNKTFNIVGCTPIFLKEYVENQFTNGMSWDKMGQYIHIDHIKPLSLAKDEKEVYELCHYSNLQPLWSEDNLKKSNKYYGR